jgi:hypothetical protein
MFIIKLEVGMGIEPMLVPHLGNTDYKSVGASSYTNPPLDDYRIILSACQEMMCPTFVPSGRCSKITLVAKPRITQCGCLFCV